MPRVNGIYQLAPGTYGSPGTPVQSAKYNTQIDDFAAEMNGARPVTAGGTGANNAAGARDALGIPDAVTAKVNEIAVKKAGDRMTGALSSAVKDHGTLGTVTEEFKFADGNTHKFICNGTVTINPTGLAEGDVMQLNILYQAGALAVSGTTQWELGGGVKNADIAQVGVTLSAGAAYRIIFEIVGGVRTGVFQ